MPPSDTTAYGMFGQQLWALGLAAALTVLLASAGQEVVPTPIEATSLAGAVWSGLQYYKAAYWFDLSGLRAAPASIASEFSYQILVCLGWATALVLLGERLTNDQWLGAALVAVSGTLWRIRVGPNRQPVVPATERSTS